MTRHYDPAIHPPLLCPSCNQTPDQLDYSGWTVDEDGPILEADGTLRYLSSDDYVWQEEGTLNRQNGHFLCDDCYIAAGMPTSPTGWVCP